MALFESIMKRKQEYFIVLFRIIVGFFFATHGMAKLGWLGKDAASGFMFFIGICEFLIGAGIFFGVLTRLAALGGAVIMIGAIIKAHPPAAWASFMKGELAWLFLAAFLVLFAMGAVRCSLEKRILKKELF